MGFAAVRTSKTKRTWRNTEEIELNQRETRMRFVYDLTKSMTGNQLKNYAVENALKGSMTMEAYHAAVATTQKELTARKTEYNIVWDQKARNDIHTAVERGRLLSMKNTPYLILPKTDDETQTLVIEAGAHHAQALAMHQTRMKHANLWDDCDETTLKMTDPKFINLLEVRFPF